MKTFEDEAFDEMAKRQGAWGGGFKAKRAMAADKLQEPVCNKDPQGCWNVRCQLGKQCKNLAQPAQEPVATVTSESGNPNVTISWWHEPALPVGTKLYTAPPQREWVGLTAEDFSAIKFPAEMLFPPEFRAGARWAEAKLKDKNT